MQDFGIYDLFFNHQVKLMYAGIEATMKKDSLLLCALALSTYTEVMGGLVTGNLKEERHSRKNYEAFLPYLGKKYFDLNNQLKKQNTTLYKIVRSKLVHEFSPRPSYMILISESEQEKIGIEVIFYENQIVNLIINVREYYRDFKNGVTKYHNKLKNWKKKQTTFGNFLKATVLDFQGGNFIPDEEP